MKMNLRICLVAIVLVSVSFLSGCNTVKGFGQDMQQGGQDLQHAADKNK